MALIFMGLNILQQFTYSLCQYTKFRMFETNSGSLRKRLAAAIISKNKKDFDTLDTGEYVSILTNDVKAVETGVVYIKINIVFLILRLISIMIIMGYFSLFLAFLSSGLSLINYIIPFTLKTKYKSLSKDISDLNSTTSAKFKNINKMAEVSILAQEERFAEAEGTKTILEFEKENAALQRKNVAYDGIVSVSGTILKALTLGVAIYIAAIGKYQAGFIISFFRYIGDEFDITSSIIASVSSLIKAGSYKEKIELHLTNKEIQKAKDSSIPDTLSVNELSFSYGDKKILNNVSGEFKTGKSYVIIGHSGEGKTTFARLISGLVEPDSGKIEFKSNGRSTVGPISDYVTYVSPHTFLFTDTIENNIDLDQKVMNKSFLTSCGLLENDRLNNHSLDEKISNGLLSGGEAQIVELCRSLSRKKPFIIFDESFVSIDKKNKERILNCLNNLSNVGLIFISHHVDDESAFDYVVKVKDGDVTWTEE